MLNAESYINALTDLLKKQFGTRLVYIGLQGSYLRGEATDSSDIDIMAVIDGLSVEDLEYYRSAVNTLQEPEKSCGFICSKADLENWNPLEICNLLGSTKDYYGTLSTLVPRYSEKDTVNFIKFSVNNLYHEICHSFIHARDNRNIDRLAASYKGVFFILQNLYSLRCGVFAPTRAQLLPLLDEKDRAVLTRSIELKEGKNTDFVESFKLLFTWCQETLRQLQGNTR